MSIHTYLRLTEQGRASVDLTTPSVAREMSLILVRLLLLQRAAPSVALLDSAALVDVLRLQVRMQPERTRLGCEVDSFNEGKQPERNDDGWRNFPRVKYIETF